MNADGKPFLDTNILLYAHTGSDARALRAQQIIAAGAQIGVQQLNEFASVATRKFRQPWTEVRRALDSLRVIFPKPTPITLETHDAAMRIAERFGYGIYDSLVLAAAAQAGCEVLYSEDMRDGQMVAGVRIRNPF